MLCLIQGVGHTLNLTLTGGAHGIEHGFQGVPSCLTDGHIWEGGKEMCFHLTSSTLFPNK